MSIDIRPYDLEIKDIKQSDGTVVEIVSIKWHMASDESFVEQMKALGVSKYVRREDRE